MNISSTPTLFTNPDEPPQAPDTKLEPQIVPACLPETPAKDLRWADCGANTLHQGWHLGWAQIIGTRHARFTEDAVAHATRSLLAGGTVGSPPVCLAVADGVGGGSRGEIVSAALVAHCITLPDALIDKPEGINQWMQLAEAQVQLKLREVSFSPGAATLAAAWLYPVTDKKHAKPSLQGHILRIGDARIYEFDGHSVHALTQDQTYKHVRETPPDGATEEDPARMVGTGFSGDLELTPITLAPGHSLLLCSDGLHRGLNEEQIASLLRQDGTPQERAQRLAQAAREAGSTDDITVLLAQVGTDADVLAAPSDWRGLFKRVFT